MNALRKTWVWLCRFRNRKGYGVHSPFAYNFIRTVINEKGKYYAYDELKPLRKHTQHLSSTNVDKLLFRLANHFQPTTATQIGTGGNLSLRYIQAGCRRTHCQLIEDTDTAALSSSSPLSMLYICDTPRYQEVFEKVLPLTDSQSVVVIDSPYNGEEKRQWWHSLEKDPRTGTTFDLYEAGIVLFNHAYNKQHYKVNFV